MLLLSRREVKELLTLEECIDAVEAAFRLRGEGKLPPPGILDVPAADGGFHIKAALLRNFFAAKVNGNFTDNPGRFGLPAIQGVIVLSDGASGRPLAVMDSIEITILRTGAATAVAARHLARPASRVVTICGCGNQGRVQLLALVRVLPLTRAFVWDLDQQRARALAAELSQSMEISPAADLAEAVSQSDVCVTCTPSRSPFLRREWLRPGTFVAAVGADSPEKRELEPSILSAAKVVVDVLDQCAAIGELHHALEAGVIRREQVHAELSEVVAGLEPGRVDDSEITLFDSTGTALQDVAAAAAVYEKALRQSRGHHHEL